MGYKIQYALCSHIGKIRTVNQDNFYCDDLYMNEGRDKQPPISGYLHKKDTALVGVFDGMGGEQCGEIASLIAARYAAGYSIGKDTVDDLLLFCRNANRKICNYADDNRISSMGTTAAVLAFSKKDIVLCNVGDSKIFRVADKKIEQISQDHYASVPYTRKPLLSQNLGIPESEMIIEPYVAIGQYNNEDIYLICSDGLTDMVSTDEILSIILNSEFEESVHILQDKALENGGRDNITIILCKIQEEKNTFGRWIANKVFGDRRGTENG